MLTGVRSSISKDYFKPSSTHTHCGWKGTASYYNVDIDGEESGSHYATRLAWLYKKRLLMSDFR